MVENVASCIAAYHNVMWSSVNAALQKENPTGSAEEGKQSKGNVREEKRSVYSANCIFLIKSREEGVR